MPDCNSDRHANTDSERHANSDACSHHHANSDAFGHVLSDQLARAVGNTGCAVLQRTELGGSPGFA
jgi:hypothetical protein